MSAKATIMIVDDQVSVRTMLRDLVEHAGFASIVAENGAEGVEKANEHKPDLIIMDLMMPVKNGLEAAREIKALPELKDIPILFLTARGQAEDEARSLEAGAAGFIAKPFSPKNVLAKISELLAARGQ